MRKRFHSMRRGQPYTHKSVGIRYLRHHHRQQTTAMEIRYDYMYRAEMRERVVPLTEVADIIRTCRYVKTCRELRWKIGISVHSDERDKFAEAENLPIMRPAVGAADSYTGIVMMSFRCDGPQQLPALRARANALPQTLMSFAGSFPRTG